MSETTQSVDLCVYVERTDGDEPVQLPYEHIRYSGGWEAHQVAKQADLDTRIMHAPYDGTRRIYVWAARPDEDDRTDVPGDAEAFDFPAGTHTAAMERQKRHRERSQELGKLTKRRLCQMLREGGLIGSMHPPEKWTKDEVISSIIDLEEIRAERDRIEAQG